MKRQQHETPRELAARIQPPDPVYPMSGRSIEERMASMGFLDLHRACGNDPGEHGKWRSFADDLYAAATEAVMPGPTFVVCGHPGTGKTQLAASVTRRVISHHPGLTLRYELLGDVMSRLLSVQGTPEFDAYMDKLARRKVLWLDEADKINDSATTKDRLHRIVDMRYGKGLMTVLLGNWPNAEVADKCLPPTVWDRMQECGCAMVCDWPSFRGKVTA